jgi:hypothetical protein
VDLLQRANERHAVNNPKQHGNNAAISLGTLHHKEQGVVAAAGASTELHWH